MNTQDDLRVARIGHAGIVALDRPAARNALTLSMVGRFASALEAFAHDEEITTVIVRSAGEGAFCAGGDVRAIALLRRAGRHEEADAFFRQEFALNELISRFPKPFVSLIDGICLGGGMGITVHGGVRIAGERAVMGMPETAIGYFPDVGASHFLNRLPRPIGRFLGLTGYLLSPADAMFTGLATAFVAAERHVEIEARLAAGEAVAAVVDDLAAAPGEGELARHAALVRRCFSRPTIGDMMEALRREDGEFAAQALARLERAAPSSLAITLDLLDRTAGLPLPQCLAIELDLACRVTRGQDFAEGVRALLIDKDRNPQWTSAETGPHA